MQHIGRAFEISKVHGAGTGSDGFICRFADFDSVQPGGDGVATGVADKGEPAVRQHHRVELVAVQHQELAPVGGVVNGLPQQGDAAELVVDVIAQRLVGIGVLGSGPAVPDASDHGRSFMAAPLQPPG